MREAAISDFGLGPIDQIGYVVRDMDASLPLYTSLYGAFDEMDAPMQAAIYRGREVDCRLRLAMNRSGPIEIELIQVVEGETPHTEYLRAHGEGIHHVRFRVSGIDEKIALMEAADYVNVFYKRWGPELAFCYLERPSSLERPGSLERRGTVERPGARGGQMVELLEMP